MTKDLEYGLRPHNYDNISTGPAVTGFPRQPDAEWNRMYTRTPKSSPPHSITYAGHLTLAQTFLTTCSFSAIKPLILTFVKERQKGSARVLPHLASPGPLLLGLG